MPVGPNGARTHPASRAGRREENAAMPWEYRQIEASDLAHQLNELDSDGWELVVAVPIPRGNSVYWEALIRRPRAESPEREAPRET